MCGISGWVSFDRDLNRQRAVVEAMTATMAARGPDGAGVWLDARAGLGHRRLAVIDPPGGAQPMVAEHAGGGEVVLTYSGEAYNYAALRRELEGHGHAFRTASDTEVVLRAYLQWGDGLVARLVGMYAFAVWDTRAERLLLVRDRLGIKPLYYAALPSGLLFGSEPKALFASGLLAPAVDGDGARELLSLVRTPGVTPFRGVREVRPGHLLAYDALGPSEHRYWALEAHGHGDGVRPTVAAVRGLLEEAVDGQLVADVPLGVLLSGGLDSSALAALAARARPAGRVRTFSVRFAGGHGEQAPGFEASADAPYVRQVVDHLGCDHADLVLDAGALLDPGAVAATLHARDLPPLGDMDTALYLMCRALRERATVALSGEGADEVFGGYPWFADPDVLARETFPWLAGAKALGQAAVFEPRLVRHLDVAAYQAERYREALAEVPRLPGDDPAERRRREVAFLHLTRFLPNPLDRKDRMSMAVGVEVRVPYCDHRLVEYVFNVPGGVQAAAGPGKGLLRSAVAGLLPRAVVERGKSPFPTTADPAYHAALRGRVEALIAGGGAPVLGLLRRSSVRALAAMPAEGSRVVRMGLERVLRLNEWLERYAVELDL